ncbi:MAG TPA: phage tail tape measure protein [Candidatus Saccharibacteria bacterium]|nr:phage tail tape measure protein [Candidatus Saccharibacteria bacterium]
MPLLGQSDQSIVVAVKSTADTSGIDNATGSIDRLGNKSKTTTPDISNLQSSFIKLTAASAASAFVFNKTTDAMGMTIKSANSMQASMIGLNSIAKAFGQNADQAQQAARDLAKDGLMTVSDAATGLKNLLASGFELPQAIKLMERFKDTAAFNRQASLSFGDAIRSATEGIKNGNSILVDNAGVTKNLSVILTEAGYSAQDLMKATTDVNVRQALFNGLLKETNPMVGDAAKLAETAAGKQAMYAAQTEYLKASIGESLQPALMQLLATVTPLIEKFTQFAQEHPKLVSVVIIATAAISGLATVLFGLGATVLSVKIAMIALGPAISGITTAFGLAKVSVIGLNASMISFAGFAVIAAGAIAATAQVYRLIGAVRELNAINSETSRQASNLGAGDTSFYNSLKKALDEGRISKEEYNRRFSAYNASIDQGVQHRASGGHVQAGNTYQVNEQGLELFTPNRSGTIIPANQTAELIGAGAVGGSSSQDNRTFTINVYPQTADATREVFNIINNDAMLEQWGFSTGVA